jgi:hypothetical protein
MIRFSSQLNTSLKHNHHYPRQEFVAAERRCVVVFASTFSWVMLASFFAACKKATAHCLQRAIGTNTLTLTLLLSSFNETSRSC